MIILKLVLMCLLGINAVYAQTVVLDDFESIDDWEVITSDGVELTVSQIEGVSGHAIRLDYSFKAGAGFCGIKKSFSLPLTENYRFTFFVKGDGPKNNLEFKLLDSSGDNVWWHNRRNFYFPGIWEQLVTRKRHIDFAWGPDSGTLDTLHALEIILAAGDGGSGSVYIDMLAFEPLAVVDFESLRPSVTASSVADEKYNAQNVLMKTEGSVWMSHATSDDQWLRIDMGQFTELGGIIIDWLDDRYAIDYDVMLSPDAVSWETVYSFRNGSGGRDYIYLPESDAQFIKLQFKQSNGHSGYAISCLEVKPVGYSETPNMFFREIAGDAQRGYFPRFLYDEQSYWTVVGVDGDGKEALLNEDGMLEVAREMFSIEPFLTVNGNFITWADVETHQTLLHDYLPVPRVYWEHEHVELAVEAIALGERGASSLYVSYTIKNPTPADISGSLFLAIRPFQVNPPWQFLNITGGFAPMYTLEYSQENTVVVNDAKHIIPLHKPDAFGATRLDTDDIIGFITRHTVPQDRIISDKNGFASGSLEFTYQLKAGEEKHIVLQIPFYDDYRKPPDVMNDNQIMVFYNKIIDEVVEYWTERLHRVEFIVPEQGKKYIDVLKSNLAYILINRDGPAIQPGSRSYERSWIRDGSLTSGALLRLGLDKPVRDFIEWYAPYQYDNGKIPCVVDRRGPDPVDEHDSPGQFIYLIMEYFRFTNDTTFLMSMWDRVQKTVEYIAYLTDQRKTGEYRYGDREMRAFYGLVPESISHEGYAEKPMHSYWDNFFILKGLKDAAEMAAIIGNTGSADRYSQMRDEFRINLYNSILLAMELREIDYIPGCVELGDFDATSTTIGIFPCGELKYIPHQALKMTFEKYIENFNRRLNPDYAWNDYTPYEVRAAGTFIFLDRIDRTHKLLEFFFNDLRPYAWNHWAEVVWRDIRKPRFIGDMPHTWVGSDYINVVCNMFLYDRPEENAVVLAAGIPQSWLDTATGVGVNTMPTYYGDLSYHMYGDGQKVSVTVSGDFDINRGNIIITTPRDRQLKYATINGMNIDSFDNNEVVIQELPAEVILQFE